MLFLFYAGLISHSPSDTSTSKETQHETTLGPACLQRYFIVTNHHNRDADPGVSLADYLVFNIMWTMFGGSGHDAEAGFSADSILGGILATTSKHWAFVTATLLQGRLFCRGRGMG